MDDTPSFNFCFNFYQRYLMESQPTTSTPALLHPLISKSYTTRQLINQRCSETEEKYEFTDPLGATIEEDLNPNITKLDQDTLVNISEKKTIILDNTLESKKSDCFITDIIFPDFESWKNKRAQILEKFTTSEKLTLSSNFIPVAPARVNVRDRTKHRLGVLEDMSGLKKITELSQHEFVVHVNELRELFMIAWNNNKRIEAVRLVTELARMLSSPATPSFYPSQWVLVTDILDLFGKFVYDRLLTKANEERKRFGQTQLSAHFVSDDIPQDTTEVAKNWFCKIADIKEIIPRFYVETALIACLRFLDSSSLRVNLLRLATMTAKFPHPLTAAYGRAYVCKITMILDAADRAPHWKALNDWMQSANSLVESEQVRPALEWVIQCVSYGAHSKEDLAPLWEYCYQEDKKDFLLYSFINAVPLKYLINHAIDACQLVVSGKISAVVLEAFGSRLLQDEISEQDTSVILRSVWKALSRLPLCEYMTCVATWSRFASRYFTVIELSTIADHIVKRLVSELVHEAYLDQLVLVVKSMVEFRGEDLCKLLELESFITIMDWLRDDPHASHVARAILTTVIRVFRIGGLKGFNIANQIVDQCGRLFLSLRPDSLTDEVRSTCRLVASALDRPLLSLDVDRGLSWLVYARATLCQRSEIITHIATLMVSFSLQCLKGHSNSSEKASFMRACVANLFITIPSIQDPLVRFRICIQAAHISLFINSLPQTDALIRLCIETINILSIPPVQLVSVCEQFLAFLVFVPDSPHKSILYMFSAFINVIERRSCDYSVLGEIWILCLRYLWAVSRPEFPVKYRNVQSNDILYGSSAEYINIVSEKTDYIINKVLRIVEAEPTSNSTTSLLLLEYIVSHVEINESIINLVSHLLKKCTRSGVNINRLQCVINDLTLLSDNNQMLKSIL